MPLRWSQIILFYVALLGCASGLRAQTLTAGSVSNIDANGNVAFSLTLDSDPDFSIADSVGRQAVSFGFSLVAGTVPPPPLLPDTTLSIVSGGKIYQGAGIVVTNRSGTVRGSVSYTLTGRTVTFSIPATVLNVSGPFAYRVGLTSYGSETGSYTGTAGGPILFTVPATLAHTVYRDRASFERIVMIGKVVSVSRVTTESTIVFEDESRYTFLLSRENGRINPPTLNGKYRLTRLSNTRAQVTFETEIASMFSRTLVFDSPSTGVGVGDSSVIAWSFSLSDLTAANLYGARNVSMRGTASAGQPLVVGLIVPGPREVLIRAVGPSLRTFGITTAWADPDFQLYRGASAYPGSGQHNADWDPPPNSSNPSDSAPSLSKVFTYVGAFPLQGGSKDAADVLRLDAGAYTIVCAPPQGDAGGDVLIEVYFLP